jgi:hypothetical protein
VSSATTQTNDFLRREIFLLSGIGIKRVREKNGGATANQKRNNDRHERFSCGKRVKCLLRE